MKTFIVNVSKYKKWITLSLSILYLLLFCFPLINNSKDDGSTYQLPFILMLPKFLFSLTDWISWFAHDKNIPIIAVRNFAIYLTCSILMLACFVLAIICVVRLFKSKKFYFIPSLSLAFLTSFVSCIYARGIIIHPTAYIFLILLILDIVYLVLEWYYVRDGQAKLSAKNAELKAERQAKQEADLKQSPEYRIEQLEKELQELKAKNNENEDGQ